MFDENGMPQKEEVEVTIPAFRVVSVFDISQTDGKPIQELETQELLSAVEGYEREPDFKDKLWNVVAYRSTSIQNDDKIKIKYLHKYLLFI